MGARRLVPLVAALAVGFVLGWLVREGTGSPEAETLREGSAPDAPTILPGDRSPARPDRGASLDAAGMRSSGEPVGRGAVAKADGAPVVATPGSTLPFIELTVVAGPGTPPDWQATAYLVAAGARGADKPEELPHADVTVGRPVRLVAPAVGLYDVGIVNEAMQLLETDVRATAEGTRIRIPLPPMAPVRFRLSNGVPPDEPNTKISGFVSLERPRDSSKWNDLPGRGEFPSRGPLVRVRGDAGATFETPPILERETFTLDLDMRETHTEGNSKSFDFSDRWELTAEPRMVRGGDVVTLTVVPLGTLSLALTAAPPAARFPSGLHLEFTRTEDGAYSSRRGHGDRSEGAERLRRDLEVRLGPGHWNVSWSAPDVAPGRLEAVEITSGAQANAAIELRAGETTRQGEGEEEEKEPTVSIELEPPLAEKQAWIVYARRGDTWPFTQRGTGPKPPEVSGDLREERAVLVVGEDRVSAPEEVPSAGPWRPRLLRAGFVMCALRTLDPTLGVVTATRTDGLPVALYRERRYVRELHAELEATLAPGLILGPFAPGPLELELFVSRKSLGVVKLSIEAGVVVPLTVPGR